MLDHWELVSVVSFHFGVLAVHFDGLSNKSLESFIFPCNDQVGREVKGIIRVPEVLTHSGCRCSSDVVVLLESNLKRSSLLTDVILFVILAMNFVDHPAFLFFGCVVFWIYQLLPCDVKRFMISANPLFSEDSCAAFLRRAFMFLGRSLKLIVYPGPP